MQQSDGSIACLVFDRWGPFIDPTQDEFFIGWAYQGETIETKSIVEFIARYESIMSADPGYRPHAGLPRSIRSDAPDDGD